eukprot:6178848-Pleurochrysis_carterae.AAC.1
MPGGENCGGIELLPKPYPPHTATTLFQRGAPLRTRRAGAHNSADLRRDERERIDRASLTRICAWQSVPLVCE